MITAETKPNLNVRINFKDVEITGFHFMLGTDVKFYVNGSEFTFTDVAYGSKSWPLPPTERQRERARLQKRRAKRIAVSKARARNRRYNRA